MIIPFTFEQFNPLYFLLQLLHKSDLLLDITYYTKNYNTPKNHLMKIIILFIFGALLLPVYAHADSIRLLEDPREAWQARIDLIEQAQDTIEVEYYAIAPDKAGTIFTGLLHEAAERGVKVRILVGGLTHASIDTDTLGFLVLHPNIEIRFYHSMEKWYKPSHWLKHLHDKILLVDNTYLITGGRNIADKYFDMAPPNKKQTIDRDVLIVGNKKSDNIPVQVNNYFNELWNSKPVDITSTEKYITKPCSGNLRYLFNDYYMCIFKKWRLSHTIPKKEKELINFMKNERSENSEKYGTQKKWEKEARLSGPITFAHDPIDISKKEDNGTSLALTKTLRNAQSSILYFTPYIIKTDNFIQTAKIANEKNVKQTVLTNSPYSGANIFGVAGTEYYYNDFHDNNIEYWMYQEFHSMHHKTYIIDNEISIFSTYNYDPRSQNLNTEMLFIIDDENFTQELKKANEVFFNRSLKLDRSGNLIPRENVEENTLPWHKRSIVRILKMVMPLIRWAL